MDMPPVNEFGQFRRGRAPSWSDEDEEQEEEEDEEDFDGRACLAAGHPCLGPQGPESARAQAVSETAREFEEARVDAHARPRGTPKTYEYWTVQDLRQHLRGHNMNSSGNKDVLIAKCQGYDKGLPQVLAGCSVATTQGSQPTAEVQVLEAKVQVLEAKIQVPPDVRELTAKVQVLEAKVQVLEAKVMEREAKVRELQEKIP